MKEIYNIPEKDWRELVTLDYILTWRYTHNYEGDLKRYLFLANKYYK